MTENTTQIDFTVSVNIATNPATYKFYDSAGVLCDGSVTVTENNTTITYSLINNTNQLIFVEPIITGDTGGDLSVEISTDKQSIRITDSDIDNENVCLQLVVAQSSNPSVTYPSPDPQIRNIPD